MTKKPTITIDTKRVRLHGITELLGGQSADDELFSNYIASKAPTDDLRDEEIRERLQMQSDFAGLEAKGLTVFPLDPKTGALMLKDYQIRGFFKSALAALTADQSVLMPAKKVDQLLFVEPRHIPICRLVDGEMQPIKECDGHFERPLRVQQFGQQDRVALTASEIVNDPWAADIKILIINNKGTAKSKPITWDVVRAALDYGRFSGLLQFRNGGYGRFEWEELKD